MKRKKRNKNNRQQAVMQPTALASLASLVRLPLLPVTAAAGVTGAIVTKNSAAAMGLSAFVAAMLHVFITAFNDYCDASADTAITAPQRFNPVTLKLIERKFALVLSLTAAAVAVLIAATDTGVNLWATLTAIAAGGLYSIGAKKFPPIGLPLIGIALGACSGVGLTGEFAASWMALPVTTAYLVIFIAAFVWAWQKRRPPLWGNNWMYLLLICTGALPLMQKLVEKYPVSFSPEGLSATKAVIMAALFAPIMLAIFFKAAPASKAAMLQYLGILWLVPVWMTFINIAVTGNALFIPAIALPLSILSVKLVAGRKRVYVSKG